MQIENVNIDALIPYARNPRKNTEAVNAVAASIKEFGFLVPIVIDADKTIIAGHRLGRICYGMELSPKYCDVILQRFYNETGVVPLEEKTGRAFIPILK